MIVARVTAGLKRAWAEGKVLGRPRVSQAIEQAIRRELAEGRGIYATAKLVGVGAGTPGGGPARAANHRVLGFLQLVPAPSAG